MTGLQAVTVQKEDMSPSTHPRKEGRGGGGADALKPIGRALEGVSLDSIKYEHTYELPQIPLTMSHPRNVLIRQT